LNPVDVSNTAAEVSELKTNPATNAFWKSSENALARAVIPLELEKSVKAISQLKRVRGKAITKPLKNLFRNMTPKANPKMKCPENMYVVNAIGSMSIISRERPKTMRMSKKIK
jgi:hypothetical protein